MEADKKVIGQYSMTIHLVRKDAEGKAEKITDYGNVRFDKNDKIVYWNYMGKALLTEK